MVGLYIYFGVYNNRVDDIKNVSPEVKIDSGQLVSSFILNEENANSVYRNKVVEIDGTVKEINFYNNRNTVLLYGHTKYTSVLCDMQSDQIENVKKLTKGQKVKLKGICKGFLKDAILLNCVLINNDQINE